MASLIVSAEWFCRRLFDSRNAPSTSPGRSDRKIRLRSSAVDASRMSSSSGRCSCSAAALELLQRSLRPLVRRVDECEHSTQPRHEGLVDLQLLGDDVAGAEDPGHVSARTGQALGQAVAERVGGMEEDDRNPDASAVLPVVALAASIDWSSNATMTSTRSADERRGLPGGLLRLEVAKDELDVLPLRPAELREARLQRLQGRRNVIGPDVHQAHAPDGLRGRAVAVRAVEGGEGGDGRERNGECADCASDQELRIDVRLLSGLWRAGSCPRPVTIFTDPWPSRYEGGRPCANRARLLLRGVLAPPAGRLRHALAVRSSGVPGPGTRATLIGFSR